MKTLSAKRSQPQPSGFTLVEMLVSVTLVLLMMTIFAQVFSIATKSVSTQRAISENDQKVRALTTVIKADFAKRTFRNLQPFFPGETSALSPTPFGDRNGYFYVSTNDADSYLDDLVQFTVSVNQISENTDQTLYFGRAAQLVDPVTGAMSLSASPNQPELDDGQLQENSTGSSSAAEVCYFIRNGNLYRRQLMIREPLPVAGQELDSQPTSFVGRDFFAGSSDDSTVAQAIATFNGNFRRPDSDGDLIPESVDDFHTYFDFSAYPNIRYLDTATPGGLVQTAGFIGLEALSNENSGTGPIISLGKPVYRWGFDYTDGLSREHLFTNAGVAQGFMGRFLAAETSAPNFNYPQQECKVEAPPLTVLKGGNPFDIDNAGFSLNNYGVISDFDDAVTPNGRGGTRAQEDLLLANVHEMKIELWDERRGDFVVPGYGSYDPSNLPLVGLVGDFHIGRNLNGAFGPDNRLTGAVFDTWHPDNSFPLGSTRLSVAVVAGLVPQPQLNQFPPYQPYLHYPPTFPSGPAPVGTSSGVPYWTPATTYRVGDLVFPERRQILTDVDSDLQLDLGTDLVVGQGFQFVYRCVAVAELDSNVTNTPGVSGALPGPSWPTTHGRRISEGEEGNPEVTWQAVDNRRSLKAIRMTLRFRNEKSNDMRQLTLVLPLADKS